MPEETTEGATAVSEGPATPSSDKVKAELEATDPCLDISPKAETVGGLTIPPMTLMGVMALQKIDSPFFRAKTDEETGEIEDDLDLSKTPLPELAATIYVVVHQQDPRLTEQMADPVVFDRCVNAMAMQIGIHDLLPVAEAIGRSIKRMNDALDREGLESSPNATGAGSSDT